MECHETVSVAESTPEALEQICRHLEDVDDPSSPPDLAVVFVSPHHRASYAGVQERILEASGARHLIGCSAESVVGAGREIEQAPAIAVWLARMPGVEVETFHATHATTAGAESRIEGLPALLTPLADAPAGTSSQARRDSIALVLGDPFSMPADALLGAIHDARPDIAVSGGMASAALSAGQNALFHDANLHDSGAVGALLHGSALDVRTVVSQGCRPIGKRYVVTGADEIGITSLGGARVKECLHELFDALTESEKARFQTSPHIGIALDEHREEFDRGDFLIRNVLGWTEGHALAVDARVRRGQTVQFHVRDADSSTTDLDEMLAATRDAMGDARPDGALLFTCNGRGSRLFPTPGHDIGTIRRYFPELAVAGFFAGGEFGRVGPRNFLHGFTASLVLFREGDVS